MKHTSGRRVTSTHGTYIDAAGPIIGVARQQTSRVKRIALGFIKAGLPSAPIRLKISAVNGGLNLKVRGSTSAQEIKLYTDHPESVKELLVKELGRKFLIS